MRVGIITLYYNSINYGGNLQAYALVKYLNDNGVFAEQIPYYRCNSRKEKIAVIKEKGGVDFFLRILRKIAKIPQIVIDRYKKRNLEADYNEVITRRKEAFHEFNYNLILHNNKVFNSQNIVECLELYDVFVTGSDQVWNLNWYDGRYFLDFVSLNKKKISYAASFSMNVFNNWQKRVVKDKLNNFYAISVREEKSIGLLNDIGLSNHELVVDPTLLLKESDWNEVTYKRLIDEKYIFCYFIGANSKIQNTIKYFAKNKRCKTISIRYASGKFEIENSKFGDIQLIDVGPEKFLSLIKYADYIFTDSFHAVVFSTIFKKEFFVFNRDSKGSMNSRITSLTEMFDLQERFCDTNKKETLEYIESLEKIDYTQDFPKFKECREKSYEFIRKNIIETQN